MDKDSRFSYSKILQFDMKQKGGMITLFPNPAVQSVNLSFDQLVAGKTLVTVIDMRGLTVRSLTENIAAGRISLNMDVSTLPAGTYLVSVINADGLLQQKFIKQ